MLRYLITVHIKIYQSIFLFCLYHLYHLDTLQIICDFFVKRSKGKKYNPKLYPHAAILKSTLEKPPPGTNVIEALPASSGRSRNKQYITFPMRALDEHDIRGAVSILAAQNKIHVSATWINLALSINMLSLFKWFIKLHCIVVTARKRSCGKVMFSHASVCSRGCKWVTSNALWDRSHGWVPPPIP